MITSRAMIVCLTALLTAVAVAPAEPAAEAKVIKLTYAPCTGQEFMLCAVGCLLGSSKPEGLTDEPKYKGEPLYGLLSPSTTGKPFLVALAPSASDRIVKDTLYVDRDQDGNLAEEKPLALAKGKCDFELAVVAGDKTVNRLFRARFYPRGESRATLVLSERGTWQAKADVGGQSLEIMAVDGNLNGRFNDAFVMPEPGEHIPSAPPDLILTRPQRPALDLAGKGICPAMVALGGALYDVDVATNGSSVTFTPYAGQTATLNAPDGLSAILSVGSRMLTVAARDGKMVVPAGSIRPFDYGFRKKDANGTLWALMADANTKYAPIKLAAGGSAAFPAVLPLRATVKASVDGKLQPGSEVSFSVDTSDATGNDVYLQSVPAQDAGKDGSGEPATVIFIKQGDKVLHRGKCGFG